MLKTSVTSCSCRMAQTCQTGFQVWLNVNFENAVGGPPSYASLSQKHQKGVALLIVNA